MRTIQEQLERRPALLAAFALALGTLMPVYQWLGVAIAALMMIPNSRMGRIGVVAMGLVGLLIAPIPPPALAGPVQGSTVGGVEAPPKRFADRTTFVLDSSAGRFIVDAPAEFRPIFSERVRVTGTFRPPPPDSRAYYDRMGLRGRARADRVDRLAEANLAARFANQLTERFSAFTAARFGPELAPLLDALVMGLDAGLVDELREDLRNSGTLHLVAASGFQVQLIAFLALLALRPLPIPRGGQLLLWACLVALYAMMAGLGVSIVRATLMAFVFAGAYLVRRDSDFLSSLGVAAIAILLWRPTALAEIGFQLSFVTVAGLGLFAAGEPGFLKWREVPRTAAVAFAFSTPIIAYHFGVFNPLAILANVLVAGLVLPIVVASLLAWAIPPLAPALAVPISAWLGWILAVVERMGMGIVVPSFDGWWLVPVYAMMFAMARLDQRQGAHATG